MSLPPSTSFGHYWEGKPTEWLLGEGITPELLNDDRMGRMLDSLYQAGVIPFYANAFVLGHQ